MTVSDPKTISGLHLFGLAAFAVSLPVFVALSKRKQFFIAYGAQRDSVLLIALSVGILLPGAAGQHVEFRPNPRPADFCATHHTAEQYANPRSDSWRTYALGQEDPGYARVAPAIHPSQSGIEKGIA